MAAEDRKRSREEREMFNLIKVFARSLRADDFKKFSEGLHVEIQLKERIERLQEYRRMGITSFKVADQYEREKAKSNHRLLPPPPIVPEKPSGRRQINPLDVSEFEGVHLLSEREKTLCSQLRLVPRSYLAIKDTLLGEYIRNGFLRRRRARELCKIDVNKTSKIYNFFIEMGWIRVKSRPPDLK